MDNIARQYQAAYSGAVLFDLSTYTKIELSGPEAPQFLHNVCTNEVKNLSAGAGCEAFLTTAKARVVAHVFIGCFRRQEQTVFWLDTVPGQADAVCRHLNHFIISEQVEVADRTHELAMFRVVGPLATARLETCFKCQLAGLAHLQHLRVSLADGATGFVRRFDALSLPAFDVICPRDTTAWTATTDLETADPRVHEILRVEAGLPAFGSDMDDNRLVMEVGRAAQAISYTKGCFLGQEPIVMARDRGQVNRMLLGVTVAAGDELKHGARLSQGEAEVGQVTSSVRSPRLGQVIALAYLKRGHQEPGLQLSVEPATDGRAAVVAALPFLPAGA
jgi:folate-binding protein YgfZ